MGRFRILVMVLCLAAIAALARAAETDDYKLGPDSQRQEGVPQGKVTDREWGHGTHNPNHGGAILPDSLRWLWRDYKPAGSK